MYFVGGSLKPRPLPQTIFAPTQQRDTNFTPTPSRHVQKSSPTTTLQVYMFLNFKIKSPPSWGKLYPLTIRYMEGNDVGEIWTQWRGINLRRSDDVTERGEVEFIFGRGGGVAVAKPAGRDSGPAVVVSWSIPFRRLDGCAVRPTTDAPVVHHNEIGNLHWHSEGNGITGRV